MESKMISFRDPELEESFSFSSFDMNSSAGFFFSDNDDDDNKEDAYIEIALQSTSPRDENGRPPPELLRGSIIKTKTREASKVATATNGNGGVMNFMVKFRSIKYLQSMLASFVKRQRQVLSPRGNKRRSEQVMTTVQINDQRLIKPCRPPPVQWNRPGERINGSNSNSNNCLGNDEKSRVLEIKLDAIREVLSAAVSVSINNRWRKRKGSNKKTKSCPSSIKSSPIHKGGVPTSSDQSKIYATENSSVQAAIDHCKRSFGQTPDFHF
uniref:Uncharacterized protein n=1 Tax=Davidia involucrata TaxID=16924 RepID=A0A5B7CCG4_DAVIN